MPLSNADLAVLGVTAVAGGLYVFRGAFTKPSSPRPTLANKTAASEDFGNPRDFIAKMKAQVGTSFRRIGVARADITTFSCFRKSVW